MELVYPATYADGGGQEPTTITNDGTTLRMRVRGVDVVSQALDDWAPQVPVDAAQRLPFRLTADGTLGDFALTFTMPIGVMGDTGPVTARLEIMLVLRLLPPWQITECFGLVLRMGDGVWATQGDHGWMEDALDDLQARLPNGMHLRACQSCAFAGYPPGGHGAFGGLACFRTCKAAFRAVTTKADLVRALERKAGWVQETFCCPEYEQRETQPRRARATGRTTMPIQYVVGDATAPQGDGPAIIVHCCNDQGGWGKGFVLALSTRWTAPEAAYRAWARGQTDQSFDLGAVQFVAVAPTVWVANLIGQHGVRRVGGAPPVRYDAIRTGLQTVAARAQQEQAGVHMPRIGAGLAGGDWTVIAAIIEETLGAAGIAVTVYDRPT